MSNKFFEGLKFALPVSLIMWALFVWLMLALFEPARADEAPEGYSNAAQAAQAAIRDSEDRSIVFEYGGGIYLRAGAYFYTAPVSSGSDREIRTFTLRIPGNATLVALYHTHPRSLTNDESGLVSEMDRQTANSMRVRSFIGVVRSGTIITYTPRGVK
jgi:hypothetical protein